MATPMNPTRWMGRLENPVIRSKLRRRSLIRPYLDWPRSRSAWPTGISATRWEKRLARAGMKLEDSWHWLMLSTTSRR